MDASGSMKKVVPFHVVLQSDSSLFNDTQFVEFARLKCFTTSSMANLRKPTYQL